MSITLTTWLLAVPIIYLASMTRSASPVFEKSNDQTESNAAIHLNYRLPNETYPEQYTITITTNVHTGEKAFQGTIIIDIVVVTDTSSIVIHSRQLNIIKVTILNSSTGDSEELSNEYEKEREFLTLRRKNHELFAAESKWKLTIRYIGELSESNGFYLSEYIDEESNYHYLASTNFESTDARQAFPCYDEPDKRANFTVTINHSPIYTAISNMPVNESLSRDGKTVFLTTPRMPTYALVFIVSDFEYSEGVLNGITQRVYSQPQAKNEHDWALISAMMTMKYLSEYYDINFMLPKLDHIALPKSPSVATENWGLITYTESSFLYNEQTSTVYSKRYTANTIAHEICHQWFGGLVTIKCWSYYWLKEAFCNYFSYKVLDNIHPEWHVWQEYLGLHYNYALNNEGSISPRPLTFHVQNLKEVNGIATPLLYSKGGAVVRMWNNALTDKVFQKGLHNFLMKNQYSSVGEEELFAAIQTAVEEENLEIPATISKMFSTWTQQGGYPILTVMRNYSDGTFVVKQEAFHDDETLKDTKTWYVPINYAVASHSDFGDTKATHYLPNVAETKFTDVKISEKDWLLLNKQSTIYCRINYDLRNWHLIADSLIERASVIHHLNRAQLMYDAYHLSFSNRLDHPILLKLLTYLKQENQYAAWSIAYDILANYNNYLRNHENYDDFRYFVAELVGPIYKEVGIDDVPGEDQHYKYIRELIVPLACANNVKECLKDSSNKLKNLVKDNTSLESEILCYGLRQSDDELFNIVYQKFMNSKDADQRNILIYTLGCTQNKNQIKKLIYSSIDESNNLRTEERYTVLKPVYIHGGIGLMACIEFLNENWNAYGNLSSNIGGFNPLNDAILRMASYVASKNQTARLLDLVAKVKRSKLVTASLEADVKENIAKQLDVKWKSLKIHSEPIMSWISEYRRKTTAETAIY